MVLFKKGDFFLVKENLRDTMQKYRWYTQEAVDYFINKIGRVITDSGQVDDNQMVNTTLHPYYTFPADNLMYLDHTKFIVDSSVEKGSIFYLLNIYDTSNRLVLWSERDQQPSSYSKNHLKELSKQNKILVVSMSCSKEDWNIIKEITYKHSTYKKLEDWK
ncbi:MAG TPA: hypothetical protein PKL44_00515 [Candidatus Dojkabacteria bacterium]|nr:hypothetical protein [Candidatus Dojkabacteria bacterium]